MVKFDGQSRLAHLESIASTLQLVRNVTWIVVEDGAAPNAEVARMLERLPVETVYLHHGPTRSFGNDQRGVGLSHVLQHGE